MRVRAPSTNGGRTIQTRRHRLTNPPLRDLSPSTPLDLYADANLSHIYSVVEFPFSRLFHAPLPRTLSLSTVHLVVLSLSSHPSSRLAGWAAPRDDKPQTARRHRQIPTATFSPPSLPFFRLSLRSFLLPPCARCTRQVQVVGPPTPSFPRLSTTRVHTQRLVVGRGDPRTKIPD